MDVITRQDKIVKFLNDVVLPELYRKGSEYQVNGDCNGNFKRIAAKQGINVYQVWFSHFQKHMDAVENFVKEPTRLMAEPIDKRVMDAVNYLLILLTLIEEVNYQIGKATGGLGSNYGPGGDGGE